MNDFEKFTIAKKRFGRALFKEVEPILVFLLKGVVGIINFINKLLMRFNNRRK